MAEAAGEGLEVRGSELLLRYAREEDAPALFALASDPDVTRFFSWGPYTDESEAAAYVRSLTRKRIDGERLELVLVHPQAGVTGVTGLSEFSLRDRRGPIRALR